MVDSFADRLECAALSDVGRKRRLNEDCYLIDSGRGLLVVADGMGGHQAGEVASRLAVDHVAEALAQAALSIDAVQAAVERANTRINEENTRRGFREGAGMGTTLVGLQMVEGGTQAIAFHVGDSRLYRYRAGVLRQLTRDHTLYQQWLESGQPGPAPGRNVILRALGPWPHVEAELAVEPVAADDLFLLCSDGLSSMVDDASIAAILEEGRAAPLGETCTRLVVVANEAGGADNVTVILARWGRHF
ncbi:MAG: protein phosphatase 2C domain-containing protein [Rhodospirillales bacterium]|nr:protein phosphatase 2C domain-containing protein [Rhodospirillales bacterium]